MHEWFIRNQPKIAMFVAGWCCLAAIDCFSKGDDLWAVINAVLVYVNIRLAK